MRGIFRRRRTRPVVGGLLTARATRREMAQMVAVFNRARYE